MSDNSERPSELIPITDFLEIVKFFDEGAKTKAGLMVWTKSNEDTARCNVIALSQTEKMIYTTTPISDNPTKLYADLNAAGDKCFLNMKVERATLFFNARLHSTSFSNLQFTLPSKIFKVQRRQRQRFKILQGYVLRVSFRDPLDLRKEFKQKIYDISSGGLSFLIDKDEPFRFEAGQTLTNLVFTIRTHEYNLAGTILHCRPFDDGLLGPGKLKIGVRFLNLPESDAESIDEYVFEENRKFFSRFM